MNRWKKLFKRSKKGMSLMVVLVSVAMLVVMGTMFTTIAMRSFNYSYSKLCKQQAYYTAEAAANALADLLYDSDEAFEVINNVLYVKYEEIKNDPNADITQVYCNVGKVGGATGLVQSGDLSPTSIIYTEGLFKDLMGTCDLRVRYTNQECTEMSLEAVATYRGYTSNIKMRIAKTSKGAEELKKIFSNSFCWSNPIVSMVGDYIDGNITITTPGEYVRDANGNIIDGNATNQALKDQYNSITVYDGNQTYTGHTKEFDINNYPLRSDNGNLYPADWAEIYLFSGSASDGMNTGTILNGDMYVQSRALIGLWDKNQKDKENYMYWDYETHSKKTNNYYRYDADGNYDSDGYVEHNFNSDVFFDHAGKAFAQVADTKLRVNGDIWLWEEARIENLDTLNTENAYNGIKNNIYALDDLVIDGYCRQEPAIFGHKIEYSREVTIYGDVMCQGDLQISDAVIVGDVYCNGDNFYMFDTTVFGNVYFRGSNLQMEWCQIYGDNIVNYNGNNNDMMTRLTSSTLPLKKYDGDWAHTPDIVDYAKDSVSYNGPDQVISGGNVIVAGLNADGTPNTEASTYNNVYVNSSSQYNSEVKAGASITNCTIAGTYYSNVNTIVNVKKWQGDTALSNNDKIDIYGDFVVNGYLFFNLRENSENVTDSSDGTHAYSYLEVDNVIAKRLSIVQNQTTMLLTGKTQIIYFNSVYTEEGAYLDGNNKEMTGLVWNDDKRKTIYIRNMYSRSGEIRMYDTNIDNIMTYNTVLMDESNNVRIPTSGAEGDIIGGLVNTFSRITGTTMTGTSFASALSGVRGVLLNKFDRQVYYNASLDVNCGLDLLSMGFPAEQEWEDKTVNMREWNAPKSDLDGDPNTVELGTVQYIQALDLSDLVSKGGARYTGANSVEIFASVEFINRLVIPENMTVEFNSIDANLHIKLNQGMVLNNNSDIILKGGHMTFLYLYGDSNNYNMSMPHFQTGYNCSIGEIHNIEGVTTHSDSLYIISNDISTMRFGTNTVLHNTFVYAPQSFIALDALSETDPGYCFSDGSLAVKGYIMSAGTGAEDYNNTIRKYTKYSYKNTEPPLITDSSFEYGNSFDEVDAYGVTIWDFVGYY